MTKTFFKRFALGLTIFASVIVGGQIALARIYNPVITGTTPAVGALDMGGYAISNGGTITATDFVATSTTATNFSGTAGSPSLPTHSFALDTNTGIYNPSADTLSVATGGAVRFDISSSNISVRSSIQFFVQSPNAAATSPGLAFFADQNTGLYNPAADELGLATGGSEKIRISSTGNIGIGTTSPYAKLSVVGETVSSYFTATSTTANGFSGALGSVTLPTYSFAGDTNTGIYSSTADSIDFAIGGGAELQITNSAILVSGGNQIKGGTGSVTVPSFSFAADGNTGMYSGGTDILSFATGGTGRLTVDSTGNVGIGTTTPDRILSVSSGVSATTTAQLGDIYSGTGKGCVELPNNTGAVTSFYFVGTTMVVEANACR